MDQPQVYPPSSELLALVWCVFFVCFCDSAHTVRGGGCRGGIGFAMRSRANGGSPQSSELDTLFDELDFSCTRTPKRGAGATKHSRIGRNILGLRGAGTAFQVIRSRDVE